MHVISKNPFEQAKKNYPNCASSLEATWKALKKTKAATPEELKQIFPSLDNFKYVDKWWVIDIGGNELRLIVFIEFSHGKVFVKDILTHAQYDKFTAKYR
ncbi:type II toxin-antitoxin system HigB family toxin [Vibrio hepatarius]|uniref:type II toxin-antitoxin system HigB family toxin n=1 Tax=Vibrio hepatarius TaxID=171383 RepID=UPI00373702FB